MGNFRLCLTICVLALQAIATFQQGVPLCNRRADIVFVVDGSSNINQVNFNNERNLLNNIIQGSLNVVGNQVHAGAVMYGGPTPSTIFLQSSAIGLTSAIRAWRYLGGQATAGIGLQSAANILLRQNGGRGVGNVATIVIFISHGTPSNFANTIQQANSLRTAGIDLFAVGIGSNVNPQQLAQITGNANKVITTPILNQFSTVVMQALSQTCGPQTPVTTPQPPTSPPVNPACTYGNDDIYLVVDVSSTAQQLSRQVNFGDFGVLKNSLNRFMATIRIGNLAGLRMGLISFSGNAIAAANINAVNSVTNTGIAINQIPNSIVSGGSNLLSALRLIVTRPQAGRNNFIVIITPNDFNSFQNSRNNLISESQRLKNLGYKIVTIPVTSNNQLNIQELSSGNLYNIRSNGYSDLTRALHLFESTLLCTTVRGNKLPGVCAQTAYKTVGFAFVAHPSHCDQYVQCYYKASGDFDLSVIRNCPSGLFWNTATSKCSAPGVAVCQTDPCKDMCEDYPMKGSCKGYFKCTNGLSEPMCCPKDHKFYKGHGCVKDEKDSCKDYCNENKTCAEPSCKKRPNWGRAGSFLMSSPSMNFWYNIPCNGKDFDAVFCRCWLTRGHECSPTMSFNFRDSTTVQRIQSNNGPTGVQVTGAGATFSSTGLTLTQNGMLHVDVNSRAGDEPLTINFKYMETPATLRSNYATILMRSNDKCNSMLSGSLVIHINPVFLKATLMTQEGHPAAKLYVPTVGLSASEFKNVNLVIGTEHAVLSVQGGYHQYVDTGMVPKGLSFPCGFDFGTTQDYEGFQGTFESVSLSSCTPPRIYDVEETTPQ